MDGPSGLVGPVGDPGPDGPPGPRGEDGEKVSMLKWESFCPGMKIFSNYKDHTFEVFIISTNTTAYWDITYHLLTALISSSFQTKRA